MLKVQLQLINKNRLHYCKLFLLLPIIWMFSFLGAINTFDELFHTGWLFEQTSLLIQVFESPQNLLLLFITLVIIAIVIYWPKIRCSYTVPNGTKITIECCDLMKQPGLKVIQSTETFDTELSGVIKPASVHGQFLTLCKQKNFDIDAAISKVFNENPPLQGRHQTQELGTICPIYVDSDLFCLVAFTRWDTQRKNIQLSEQEYLNFLQTLWNRLSESAYRNERVNIAVLGNANLTQSKKYTTDLRVADMINSFLSIKSSCCKELNICIHTSNVQEIDFSNFASVIHHLYRQQELNADLRE